MQANRRKSSAHALLSESRLDWPFLRSSVINEPTSHALVPLVWPHDGSFVPSEPVKLPVRKLPALNKLPEGSSVEQSKLRSGLETACVLSRTPPKPPTREA